MRFTPGGGGGRVGKELAKGLTVQYQGQVHIVMALFVKFGISAYDLHGISIRFHLLSRYLCRYSTRLSFSFALCYFTQALVTHQPHTNSL